MRLSFLTARSCSSRGCAKVSMRPCCSCRLRASLTRRRSQRVFPLPTNWRGRFGLCADAREAANRLLGPWGADGDRQRSHHGAAQLRRVTRRRTSSHEAQAYPPDGQNKEVMAKLQFFPLGLLVLGIARLTACCLVALARGCLGRLLLFPLYIGHTAV